MSSTHRKYFVRSYQGSNFMKKRKLTQSIFLPIAASLGFFYWSCQENYSLYEDIPTVVTAAQVHSHNEAGYTPVPDSLRLRFQPQLRMLRCTVVAEGCDPHLETRVEATFTQLTIRFDMNNACRHDLPEYFDVDIFVSPVHPDTFALVVEQVDFAANDPASRRVVLSERVNVRTLPGF
jgi:hypothetical protein